MRFPSRLVAATLLAAGAAACTDTRTITTPIPPGKVAGRISLNPVFSASAKTIAASIADFGITFDRVRVRIRNTPDTTTAVLDTTVAFGPSSAPLVLDLTVPVVEVGQSFNALVEYIGTTGVVYSGSIIVQSYAPDGPTPEQPTLVLTFVGPGAKLKTLAVTPKPVKLVGSQTVPLTIAATDSNGAALPVPPLIFASSDESVAKVVTNGSTRSIQSFGKRGQAHITATTPIGIQDTLSAIVSLPAASVAVVSGADQSATVGTQVAQPLVVQVSASDGVGVPDVTVTFTPPAGASVGSPTAVTDANGRASTTLTLSTAAGTQTFGISAGSVPPAIVGVTARPGPASAATSTIIANGAQFNADDQPGVTISVLTRDQYGNAIGGGGATVTLTTTLGHWAGTTATTTTPKDNGDGSYSATLQSAQSGTATITGTIAGVAIAAPPVTVTAIPTVLDHFDITLADGSPLSGTKQAGVATPIKITAKDVSGGTVAGDNRQTILSITNSTLVGGNPSLIAPAAVGGVSSMTVSFGQPGTNVTLDAAGGGKVGHSAPFSVAAGSAATISVVGQSTFYYGLNQTPPQLPVLVVKDAGGNPVAGQRVSFNINEPCSVNAELTTDSQGRIAFDNTSLRVPAGQDFQFSCKLFGAIVGAVGAPPVYVALVTERSSEAFNPLPTIWTGNASDAWETQDNWTISTPSSSLDVWIPAAQPRANSTFPVIRGTDSFVAIRSLDVETGANLNLNGHTLNIATTGDVGQNVDARNSPFGVFNGTLAISAGGNGAYMRGRLPTVNVQGGPFRVLEQAQTSGNLTINGGSIDASGGPLVVGGDFATAFSGTLHMSEASVVSVAGSATFGGGPVDARDLAGGVLLVQGNFTQTGTGTFQPGTDHVVQIGALTSGDHTVSFSDVSGSWFQNLQLVVGNGHGVTIAQPVQIRGSLAITGTGGGANVNLPQGLSAQQNGDIAVGGPGVVITIGGGINTSELDFLPSAVVRLEGTGALQLANGRLTFGANAHVTINATGTFVPPAANNCSRGPGVVIDGSNTVVVAALNNPTLCPQTQ
jgi:hypothetical protein